MKELHPQIKKAIYIIVLAMLCIITLLALAGQAGQFGNYYKTALDGLFGYGIFLVPIILLGLIFRKQILFRLGLGLFVLSLLGIFEIFNLKGGYIGAASSYFLLKYTGISVSLIILSGLVIVAVLIALNIPVFEFFKRHKQEKTQEQEQEEERAKTEPKQKIKKLGIFARKKDAGAEQCPVASGWQAPAIELLDQDKSVSVSAGNIENNQNIIQRTLENFGIEVAMAQVNIGPTVTQYTLKPAIGVKLARITALQNDLAMALAARSLRIEAPILGKSLVGIEIPNEKTAFVRLAPLLTNEQFNKNKPILGIALGRDVAGQPYYSDLARMPHMLIAGATGSGKTICINTVLLSLLYNKSPDQLKLILIDPKRVELTSYNGIPHLLSPAITDAKKAVQALKWALSEMDDRFKKLEAAKVRDISSYKDNDMPYIIIVIDELADLMMTNPREVEAGIVRLSQMARAVGIHLIVSTQRPSVSVITGLIKANITTRIAFQVATQVDSRTILDMAGAEKLLGRGDMLFLSGDSAKPKRLQGALVTDNEVKRVVKQLSKLELSDNKFEPKQEQEIKQEIKTPVQPDDEMYDQAKELVITSKKASASLLQRHLRVGYARAARLLDLLEANNIVGPHQGAKPRQVLIEISNHDNA